ncbi:alpha/beta fold hydrolase [Evansella halocellulosilytica]|uniref:alpha/beta fold hydrolase n=1 Tax=Evansella halocellulosilytica TaxID=2011013 RepID=UPI000BB7CF0F|nr:alpha/beta hydrolase [Evansella halocellulosilytica]
MAQELFVEINGFKLFAKLCGENKGKPAVIMEAGYGDTSTTWDPILHEISNRTEVLVYDRAGVGKSEKSPNSRTSKDMVSELNLLIKKLELKRPFIFVGHSFGGVNVRLFASQYPDKVCGLILVDSTPADYVERFLPTMSEDFQKAYKNQFFYEGDFEEMMISLNQLKENKRVLSVPLTVLSAGNKAHYSKASQKLWNDMQKDIVNISSNSEIIVAEKSSHYIHHDEPEVVIRAINRIIDQA